jgi:hypothetical protein
LKQIGQGTRAVLQPLFGGKGASVMADEQGTETQPRPNISTENVAAGDVGSTKTQPAPNISTEHQQPGDARSPSDHLDSEQSQQDDGGRRSSLTDPDAT